MTQQPEALRLADAMDAVNTNNTDSLLVQMAARSAAIELRRLHALNAELRRLHEENEQLTETDRDMVAVCTSYRDRITTLEAALQKTMGTLENMNHADSIFAGEFDQEITTAKQALGEKK